MHGGDVEADGNCLFTTSQKAMGSMFSATDLRRRTVNRFLEDLGSMSGVERDAIDAGYKTHVLARFEVWLGYTCGSGGQAVGQERRLRGFGFNYKRPCSTWDAKINFIVKQLYLRKSHFKPLILEFANVFKSLGLHMEPSSFLDVMGKVEEFNEGEV
ncbi:hypothetical protein F0562_021564 [Nyssa sinensis]|uniref:OTU domain-containing protein n=1 Tax=Nyssa sinensis TaxID=561372 RepID=A0A5J5BNF7_9ASTE|nr:hypothetical protein F0562_021564 [Nyssa sinensis]